MLLQDKKRRRTDRYSYMVRFRQAGEYAEKPVEITFVDGAFEGVKHPFKEPYSRFSLEALAAIEEEVCKLEAAYQVVNR